MVHRATPLAVIFLFSLTFVICAQNASEKKSAPTKAAKSKLIKSEEVDPALAERRVVAISLLTSLADEARSYREGKLRVRVQARVADALWDTDAEKSRSLFRQA